MDVSYSAELVIGGSNCQVHGVFSGGIDCSVPVRFDRVDATACARVGCFGLPRASASYLCGTATGASVNCEQLQLCAHANGTHTEGVGHVTVGVSSPSAEAALVPVSNAFITETEARQTRRCRSWFPCTLLSVSPVPLHSTTDTYTDTAEPSDMVITRHALIIAAEAVYGGIDFSGDTAAKQAFRTAVCIRTVPNAESWQSAASTDYSGTNPPYLTAEAAALLGHEWSVQHVLIDVSSVDREDDGGSLLSHRRCFGVPDTGPILATEHADNVRSITELAYFPDTASDAIYMLNLCLPNLESDAVPSRPLLYPLSIL